MKRLRRPLGGVLLAVSMLASGGPGAAVVPYQAWTPSSFGLLPECGKAAVHGYLNAGCIITRRIRFSPGPAPVAYVGTFRHGPWVSATGSSWMPLAPQCLTDLHSANVADSPMPCGVEDFAFDPIEPTTIYATGYEASSPLLPGLRLDPGGVLRSTDGGASWTRISSGPAHVRGAGLAVTRRLASEKPTIIVGSLQHAEHDVGSKQSLAISHDGGASWRSVRFTPPKGCRREVVTSSTDLVGSIVVDPTNPDIVYAGSNGGLYRSTNRGRSWSLLLSRCVTHGKFNIGFIWGIAVAPDGRNVYAGLWDGTIRVAPSAKPTQWRTLVQLDGTQITSLAFDRRDPGALFVGSLKEAPGKPARAAGVYRVRISGRVGAELLGDSYASGVNQAYGRLGLGSPMVYSLIQNMPPVSIAQHPVEHDLLYMSQMLGGVFWRSMGQRIDTGSPPSIPATTIPTAMPAPSLPALPPASPPTAIPTATPTFLPSR